MINSRRKHKTVNIYPCNIREPKYIKQILTDTKGETDSNIIILRDFNTHLNQWTHHLNRKSIRKHWPQITDWNKQILYTFIDHSIKKQYSTHSLHVYMEYSPGQITCQTTKQVSLNLRNWKLSFFHPSTNQAQPCLASKIR